MTIWTIREVYEGFSDIYDTEDAARADASPDAYLILDKWEHDEGGKWKIVDTQNIGQRLEWVLKTDEHGKAYWALEYPSTVT
jgi:hypothetical protein